MRYQDQIVRSTQKALEDIIRAASAVPSEKTKWRPMGQSRSVLDQMQEIAAGGSWFIPILQNLKVENLDAHQLEEVRATRLANDTLEKCFQAARLSTMELCKIIEKLRDEDLEKEVRLPFGGGMTVTIADIAGMHSWNMVYHLGQINQIQLMLGDREMH